jgi:hypothetical protein
VKNLEQFFDISHSSSSDYLDYFFSDEEFVIIIVSFPQGGSIEEHWKKNHSFKVRPDD